MHNWLFDAKQYYDKFRNKAASEFSRDGQSALSTNPSMDSKPFQSHKKEDLFKDVITKIQKSLFANNQTMQKQVIYDMTKLSTQVDKNDYETLAQLDKIRKKWTAKLIYFLIEIYEATGQYDQG